LFGATYAVIAPEHALIAALGDHITNRAEIEEYAHKAAAKSDEERIAEGREKSGVEIKGIKAVNPATGGEIPVFVADYVLASYGTGAIMAVPAHDERDFEFAKKFELPIIKVIVPKAIVPGVPVLSASMGGASPELRAEEDLWEGVGDLVNSGEFSGMDSEKAKMAITEFVHGRPKAQFHLRDWVFSRQHYWGEPIPIVFCEKDGMVPVPENELPVLLPEIEKYQPTDNGESPLAAITEWVNVKCPKCGGPARRETDTMPNWAGSSWYFLRYVDPKNDMAPADPKKLAYWMPVDWYNGGMEHTTLHLLYSRFWNKFLNDIGVAPTSEPYTKRTSQGMVLGKGGEKMSKSKGNVVNPDFIVANFGADILRVYEMFMGPFDQAIPWDEKGILGSERFLVRFWKYCEARISAGDSDKKEGASAVALLHRTIKKVGEDIEAMKFNTAISALMILLNELEVSAPLTKNEFTSLVKIIHPFTPHMAQELWSLMGNETYLDFEPWPTYDAALIAQEKITIVFQVNGKTKDSVSVDSAISEEEAKTMALASEKVKASLAAAGGAAGATTPKRVIYVDKKLVNIVI
jgi:leucyl-tRNA synthetase